MQEHSETHVCLLRYYAMEANAAESPRPRRLSQPERSAATRQALLDSTIECLVELGYQNATTEEISERAGLSRGAHLHHFQTRGTLFAAAAGALAERAEREQQEMVESLPTGPGRAKAALDGCWQLFNGPVFQAVIELSVSARTDPGLSEALDPAQRVFGRDALQWLRRAFDGTGNEDQLIEIVLATIRGLVVLRVIEPAEDPQKSWKRARGKLLALLGRGADGAAMDAA